MSKVLRQGDVLLIPSSHPSFRRQSGTVSPVVSQVAGRHVLAYGEVTGHHHSIPSNVGTLTLDECGVTYLTIEELTEVTHQEHGAITLTPGVFEVRRQREWSDEQEPRPVLD